MALFDRSSKFPVRIIFCAVLVFSFAGKISPAGGLDPTFGTSGVVQTTVGTKSVGKEMTTQPDGKIIVVGYGEIGDGNLDFVVARFNPNGSLDTSFDGDGKVLTPIGAASDTAYAVAVQADGKILVAGVTQGVTEDFALVRYNPDGSLDTTFDGDGKVITPVTADSDFINTIAIQPDGKIVAAGLGIIGQAGVIALARYNADGSLDTSFNGTGTTTTFLRNVPYYDEAHKAMVQPDGKILAAGRSYSGTDPDFDFALVRYNANGSLDTSFDGDGKLTTQVAPLNYRDEAYGAALQPDGKILAVGGAFNRPDDYDSAVVRYNTDGSLDTTFDGDGKAYFSIGLRVEALQDVAVLPDGKIVAAGHRSLALGSTDLAIARLNPNGSLDTTFDGDGKVAIQLGGLSTAYSVEIQPNGKVTAGGYSYSSSIYKFLIARFMGDVHRADFDGDAKTDLSIFRPSNGQWWYQNRGTNSVSALTFGSSTDKITPGDYTGDGKTDVAFWRPSTGEWFVLRSEDFSYYSLPFGANGDIPAPGDFDGDGKTDETVFRPTTATWYVLRSSGGTTIQQFGANGDVPLAGDYDGDGKTDIGIFRPAGGEWWIQKSSDSQVFATQFGASSDIPVTGDYTGDSKTDIAFWRPSNGSWYVLRSEDFSYYSFPFGTNGDIPAPGDYDGDGKTDAAVFRPPTATWYLQRSTAGTLIQQFGANGDLPAPGAFVP